MSTIQTLTWVFAGLALVCSGMSVYYAVQSSRALKRAERARDEARRLTGGAR